MSDENAFRTRRTVLQSVSVAIAGGSLAGCLDDSVSDNDGDDDPTNDGTLASDDNDTDASDGSTADDSDDAIDGIEIAPGTQIDLSAQTTHWEGLAPSALEATENPTLILEAGATYTIGWSVGDGAAHNMEIRNDSDVVVDGLQTEIVADPGEDQFLEFTASPEMTQYACRPHSTTMGGEIVVVDSVDPVTESDTDTDDEADPTDGTPFELEPGADIRFSGQTVSWEGLAPSALEGEENPTLILQDGADYTIGWTEGDGAVHNMEIRNEHDEVIGDLATAPVSEPGKDQILEFTASPEMTQYVCRPHAPTMVGEIRVE